MIALKHNKINYLNKAIVIAIIVVFFVRNFAVAQNSETLFNDANNFYGKGKYAESISIYKKIIANNECSGELYFNLGNAYYKLDSVPQSILYFEKAKVLLPNDEDLNTNLRLANLKTTDKIEPVPQLFLMSWYQSFLQKFTTNQWAWISIVLSIFTFLLFGVFISTQNKSAKRLSFFSGVFFTVSTVVSCFFTSAAKQLNSTNRGVIFAQSITLKSEPNDTSTSLFVLHEGATCRITEKLKDWYRIKLDNGNEGWLLKSNLKEI